jgi:TonB family protein
MKAISFILLLVLVACATPTPAPNPIEDPIVAKYDEFRQCFLESNSYPGRHSEEKGAVEATFQISPEGRVKKARISGSSFKDPNFHACLLGILREIKFEAPKDGKAIPVTLPINFYPVE